VTLPIGIYRATVRTTDAAFACQVAVREGGDTPLETRTCVRMKDVAWSAKGESRFRKRFSLEVGVGIAQMHDDAFTRRMTDFGYETRFGAPVRGHLQVSAMWNALPYLSLVVEGLMLELGARERVTETMNGAFTQAFKWESFGLAAGLRGGFFMVKDRINPYLQLSAGPAFSLTRFSDNLGASPATVVGWMIRPALGCNFQLHPNVGLFAQLSWVYAPVLRSLLGDVHDSGGFIGAFGVRVSL
jgi:hypothetical protein